MTSAELANADTARYTCAQFIGIIDRSRRKPGILRQKLARAIQDRLHKPQGLGIFLRCLRLLPRQRFTPLVGMGGRWNLLLLVHRYSDLVTG
jgi:hypothetical protein